MEENQKGITIVGLLITVIVIVIIAGVCIYTGKNMVGEAKLEQLRTNMLLIQAKCQGIEEKKVAKEPNVEYVGTQISENTTVGVGEHLIQIDVSENNKWYKLTRNNIEEDIGLGDIGGDDNDYVVNYNDGEVVYTKGYKHSNGTTYYTLTDIKDL